MPKPRGSFYDHYRNQTGADIARDTSIDLSQENMDVLIGFGLDDFKTVSVPLRVVARCMRWQCLCLDGSWDYKQFKDLPHYKAKVRILDLSVPELRYWLVTFVQKRLGAIADAA
jgi:hypothetical protein